MELLVNLLITGGVIGILDFLWLGYLSKKLYKNEIGGLLLEKPNMVAALIFYAIYVVGAVVFVVNPALENGSLAYAIGYGALFGLVAYGTYDLTNLAVMKGFTKKIVVVDMLWGVLLTTVVASVAYLVMDWVF